MNDYAGYEWGWIDKDGQRLPSGEATAVMPDKIAGVWSFVKRKDIEKPFYHEVFLEEYKSDKGSWGERPITMLLKLSQSQAYKRAYVDKTNFALTEDEIITLPELFEEKIKKLQLWKCQACGHTFYTPLEKKDIWYRRLLGLFSRSTYIECEVCSEIKASKAKIVTKRIRE